MHKAGYWKKGGYIGLDENRKNEIHEKGFNIADDNRVIITDYGKIKIGSKILEDAVLDLASLKLKNPASKSPFLMKGTTIKAIMDNDIPKLRDISKFYYKYSGIYERAANFFATLYRYDWYTVPEVYDEEPKKEKILKDFAKALDYLDNSHIKKICGEIALTVIVEGAYYGYVVDDKDRVLLQQLPIEYCRTRYSIAGVPAIEFNMAFFDTFKDINYRMRILNLFPDEFKKGYMLFKQGKL